MNSKCKYDYTEKELGKAAIFLIRQTGNFAADAKDFLDYKSYFTSTVSALKSVLL